MHIAWTRHLLDNREFIVGGGTQPNTEPSRGEGLDGSATAEERDNYHRDAYENARNHASGPPCCADTLRGVDRGGVTRVRVGSGDPGAPLLVEC